MRRRILILLVGLLIGLGCLLISQSQALSFGAASVLALSSSSGNDLGASPSLVDVVITLDDLPKGFRVPSKEDLKLFALDTYDPETEQTKNFWVFGKGTLTKYELLVGSFFKPLSAYQQAELDLALNPNIVQLIPDTVLLPKMDRFGDRSIGVKYSQDNGKPTYQVVLVRRGNVAFAVGAGYYNGAEPSIGIDEVTQILDRRLAKTLGK